MSSVSSSWFLRLRTVVIAGVVCASALTITHIVRADAPKTAADYAADPAGMIDAYRIVNEYTGRKYETKINGQLLPLYRRAAELLAADGAHLRAAGYALKGIRTPGAEYSDARRRATKDLVTSLKRAVTR